MRDVKLLQLLLALVLLGFAANSESRHLKLYAYDIADVGATVSTYTLDWVSGPEAGTRTGNPTFHEIEIEHAITEHWMQSFYIDYDYRDASGGFKKVNEVTSLKTEFNFPFSEKGRHFFDFRMNIELAKAVNSRINAYGETDAADTAEFRFILEKNFDSFTLVLGPMFVQNIAGPDQLGGPSYGFANAVLVDLSDKVGVGLELHSFMGEGGDLDQFGDQSHTLVPNIDIVLTDDISVSVGAGFGLTDATDDFTFRSAVQYVFQPKKKAFPSRH